MSVLPTQADGDGPEEYDSRSSRPHLVVSGPPTAALVLGAPAEPACGPSRRGGRRRTTARNARRRPARRAGGPRLARPRPIPPARSSRRVRRRAGRRRNAPRPRPRGRSQAQRPLPRYRARRGSPAPRGRGRRDSTAERSGRGIWGTSGRAASRGGPRGGSMPAARSRSCAGCRGPRRAGSDRSRASDPGGGSSRGRCRASPPSRRSGRDQRGSAWRS